MLGIAYGLFGRTLAIRRVDHTEHVKLLICLRLEGPMPAVVQHRRHYPERWQAWPNSVSRASRYFNLHGIHPKRLKPYIWRSPATRPTSPDDYRPRRVRSLLDGDRHRLRSRPPPPSLCVQPGATRPKRCTPGGDGGARRTDPQRRGFEPYGEFIEMGAAMFGASTGAEWGRMQWLALVRRSRPAYPGPASPEIFWDLDAATARPGQQAAHVRQRARPLRNGAQSLRRARDRAGGSLSRRRKRSTPGRAFLEGWVLVGSEAFYPLPPSDRRHGRRST